MSRSLNKVTLLGHLGADPDMRYTDGGTAIARFSLATSESVQAGEGNWEPRTAWHRVVAFGKHAENCSQYLKKGSQVWLEGKLQTRQWEDSKGVQRWSTEIALRDIIFLKGGNASENSATAPEDAKSTGSPEEDIPF
ncbi:single-stranded DNA-binding protein [Desulfoferrobacter suflitae]|uniref:single-stranded DNA-binding protein n=1 Tax=Desulfoferrobacter suflitae TaxID=2865782 RepID=UPI0021643E30|nr:single-stranded DNA-binding protein [Desulfoferrobacter suflitae]MCK8603787.1 single-stranded DNA-binding protein [Desulfoferrobacter suflitae]